MSRPILHRQGAPAAAESWIAGGTNLVDLMKLGIEQPAGLVDLGPRRATLSGIADADGGLTLGAMTTMAEAERDLRIQRDYPAVHLALALAASPQIREMATLGGNLLQRTRCTYFRDGHSPCNKRAPSTGCAAIGGDDAALAILGTSENCMANYPGDLAVALVMLGADMSVEDRDGRRRRIAVQDLYRLPGATPNHETTLAQGDLITAIHLPVPTWTGQTYVKLRDRASYAFASASAAVALEFDGSKVSGARITLGGLATVPWRCAAAEGRLIGCVLDEGTAMETGRACLAEATPSPTQDHKVELGARAVAKALVVASHMHFSDKAGHSDGP